MGTPKLADHFQLIAWLLVFGACLYFVHSQNGGRITGRGGGTAKNMF